MIDFTEEFAEHCANDDQAGPVALTLRQALVSVEGADAVVFPPTYARIGYNIDPLPDGTKVATIDSVGAQANRLEPLFKAAPDDAPANPRSELVPQVDIELGNGKSVSVLDAGHRLGDALIRCTALAKEANRAFLAFADGDASVMAKLAPTSLVFGAWDSRDTLAKLPRILQSVIRAWDVDELKRSAQYNPPVDYAELGVVSEAEKQEAVEEVETKGEKAKSPLAQRGFVHVPATRQHGGVVVRGEIRRDVTINLIALRRLDGANGAGLRRYVLGLALVAATADPDGFLRQGCLLTPDPDNQGTWERVGRDGGRSAVDLNKDTVLAFARKEAKRFGVARPLTIAFDPALAKGDIEKAKKKDAKKA